MDWWPIDAAPVGAGNRLLVGVPAWSDCDLTLLDLLDEAIRTGRGSDTPVGVFDIDRVSSLEQLERLLPGLGPVHQTPLAGYWVAGKLIEAAPGFLGRQLVCQLFGINHKAVIDRPAVTPR